MTFGRGVLLFVPGYDEATRANVAVAQAIAREADTTLFDEAATSKNLADALVSLNCPLMVMSHGREHGFVDQRQQIFCP